MDDRMSQPPSPNNARTPRHTTPSINNHIPIPLYAILIHQDPLAQQATTNRAHKNIAHALQKDKNRIDTHHTIRIRTNLLAHRDPHRTKPVSKKPIHHPIRNQQAHALREPPEHQRRNRRHDRTPHRQRIHGKPLIAQVPTGELSRDLRHAHHRQDGRTLRTTQPDARRERRQVNPRVEKAHAINQRAGSIDPKEFFPQEAPVRAGETAALAGRKAAFEQRQQRHRQHRHPDGDDAQRGLVSVLREQELDDERHAGAADSRRRADHSKRHAFAHDPPFVDHAHDGIREDEKAAAVHHALGPDQAGNRVAEGTGDEAEDADGEPHPYLMRLVFGETLGDRGRERGPEVTESLGNGSYEGDFGFGVGELREGEVVILEHSKGNWET
ncbi:hypothetical protein NHQ30_008535 [Ciborinia camelliae]|nr:hypothetical protein NHQ30_008535 [Ciborinia camelliae]